MARFMGAGIEHDAGLLAELADGLERAVQVRARLRVDADDVSAGLGEGFEIGIDRRDHQMHVEGLRRVRAAAPSPRRGRW